MIRLRRGGRKGRGDKGGVERSFRNCSLMLLEKTRKRGRPSAC
jgi:hypothetical protein